MADELSTIDIVIPVRKGSDPSITLKSLEKQTFKDFRMLVVQDEWQNANAARNHGFKHVSAPFVMFADDDIYFFPTALADLVNTLSLQVHAAYCYGAYSKGGRVVGGHTFDEDKLFAQNYISTMSLIRTECFKRSGGFDESIQRLQDYDLWLTMLSKGDIGVYCGKMIFTTEVSRTGISSTGTYEEAKDIIFKKHKLGRYRDSAS